MMKLDVLDPNNPKMLTDLLLRGSQELKTILDFEDFPDCVRTYSIP